MHFKVKLDNALPKIVSTANRKFMYLESDKNQERFLALRLNVDAYVLLWR